MVSDNYTHYNINTYTRSITGHDRMANTTRRRDGAQLLATLTPNAAAGLNVCLEAFTANEESMVVHTVIQQQQNRPYYFAHSALIAATDGDDSAPKPRS